MNEEIKPDRISFKQVFPSGMQYLPLHIGIEYPVLPGQDPNEIFKTAVEQVRKWNLEHNHGMAAAIEFAGNSQNGKEPEEDVTVEDKASDISTRLLACKDARELKTYRYAVYAKGVPGEIQSLYENLLRELNKSTV